MLSNSSFLNDGSEDSPKLKVYLNLDSLVDLRVDTIWPGLEGRPRYQLLFADGFEGVQLTSHDPPIPHAPIPHCGLDRINLPADADSVAARHAARGDLCLTVHAGWGLEDEAETLRLVEAILTASDRHRLPIFIETHRATITQDVWRTVEIVKKFPEVRFNGDFSHYYCGQELVYGDWNAKLDFMQPIFDRVGFLHGRIASPGSMQVPILTTPNLKVSRVLGQVNYLDHFKELWTRSMYGFIRTAKPGDVLIFAPELLSSTHYYARKFPDASGEFVEESDRYHEAILYKDLARSCFAEAKECASRSVTK